MTKVTPALTGETFEATDAFPTHARAVVIGGGLVGCSVLYHLAKLGWKDLVLLERLTPLERACFLLREVFGYSYRDVAETVGRNEAACRQLVHRARAAIEAGTTRFRPVLMTAAAMIMGMVPMATGYSQNAPLGRAVIGGLLMATLFTLLFVPCVYAIIYSRRTAQLPKEII